MPHRVSFNLAPCLLLLMLHVFVFADAVQTIMHKIASNKNIENAPNCKPKCRNEYKGI